MSIELQKTKSLFKTLQKDFAFFGLSKHAFNRVGPEEFIEDYSIAYLKSSLEDNLISQDIKIFCLEEYTPNWVKLNKKNSTTLVQNSYTKKFVKKQSQERTSVLIPYGTSSKLLKTAKQRNWIIAGADPKFRKRMFENKIYLRKLLDRKGISQPKWEAVKYNRLGRSFDDLQKKLGTTFVVQYPRSGGGFGTATVSNRKELLALKRYFKRRYNPSGNSEVLCSQFIRGTSPSVTGVVTPWGVVSGILQQQILDIEECVTASSPNLGRFCGHSWRTIQSQKAQNKAKELVHLIGDELYKKGYRGIFGIDLVWSKKTRRLYPIDVNPRLLGSYPTLTMVEMANNRVPLIALHMLSFLPLSQRQSRKAKKLVALARRGEGREITSRASQIFVRSQKRRVVRSKSEIKPGIYRLYKGRLLYLRPGYTFRQLKKPYEFILTDGVPELNTLYAPAARVLRLIFARPVLKKGKPSDWVRTIIQASHDLVKLR